MALRVLIQNTCDRVYCQLGQDNNIIPFVSSIIKGHQQEMDQNSFVQVSLDGGSIPVAPLGGAAVVIPGLLKAHGKLT